MMAHLVLNYDIKLEKEGVRPPNEWFAASCIPNTQGEVLFRKRQSWTDNSKAIASRVLFMIMG